MKFIKLAIISVFVFFIILTAFGLLLPSTVRVTRNISIHTPQDTLYYYLTNLKEWPKWMEGIEANTMKFTTAKTNGAGTVTAIGKQQIRLTKDTRNLIESVWQNSSQSQQLCVFELLTDTSENATKLNWYYEQKLSWYPWERLPALANDKILGPFMEHSLDKLKELTEGK